MALITCPECGKSISDKATACPSCGFPVKELGNSPSISSDATDYGVVTCPKCGFSIPANHETCDNCGAKLKEAPDFIGNEQHSTDIGKARPVHDAYSPQHVTIPFPGQNKNAALRNNILLAIRWCIAAFFLYLSITLLSFYGADGFASFLFLAACVFFVSPLADKIPVAIPTAVKIILPIVFFFSAVMFTPDQSTQTAADLDNSATEEIATTETGVVPSEPTLETVPEPENTTQEDTSHEIAESESPVADQPTYINVFDLDLKEHWSDYVGEYVQTTFEVGDCEDDYIESTYENDYFRVYPDNYRTFEYGDYITVSGKLTGKPGLYIEIKEAHIENYGSKAQSLYDTDFAAYNERKAVEAAEYEAAFKEKAEAVSYENLSRYPDTYTDKEVKITVKITDVKKKDSMIFADSYIASMAGNEIAIYDERELKEPKLLEGDTVVIYGRGKGLTEIKTYDKSGILPKVIDKRKIPAISIEFIEIQ